MKKKSGKPKPIELIKAKTSNMMDSWTLIGYKEVETYLNTLQQRIDELEEQVLILLAHITK